MKHLITLVLIILAAATQAQDTTLFVPNYGIDIMSYEIEQRLPNDTVTMQHIVRFNSKRELGDKVVFYYDVKSINIQDSILVNHVKQLEVVLGVKELNAIVQGKKVYEWLELIMPAQDSTIIKALADIAYRFKVIGNN